MAKADLLDLIKFSKCSTGCIMDISIVCFKDILICKIYDSIMYSCVKFDSNSVQAYFS